MGEPAPSILTHFWSTLQGASQRVLFLDYDGTLAPFQVDRDRAFPYPGIPEILAKIQSSGHTRLIIVSGRTVTDLLELLGLENFPEIWGSHGFERRLENGSLQINDIEPEILRHLSDAYTWMQEHGYGGDCEKKPSSVAFHWRREDENKQRELEKAVRSAWTPLTKDTTLEIHPFDGGLELRYAGFHKGIAVDRVLSGYGSGAAVAYLGDDFTDEDAFRALKGRGLSVLVRETYRETLADCWLKPPDELLSFLKKWHRLSSDT
jgi:trehalose-phosphatase